MNATADPSVSERTAGADGSGPDGPAARASTAAPGADEAPGGDEARFGAVFAAGAELVGALHRALATLAALCVAEARLLRASVSVVIVGGIALVALAVSLWACVVALLGWALVVATHSVGIALAILVAVHAALVVGVWIALARVVRSASFPATRAELRALGGELREQAVRAGRAASAPDREASP